MDLRDLIRGVTPYLVSSREMKPRIIGNMEIDMVVNVESVQENASSVDEPVTRLKIVN